MFAQQYDKGDARRRQKAAETERNQPLGAAIYRWRDSECVCVTEDESLADVYIAARITVTRMPAVSGAVKNERGFLWANTATALHQR